MRTASLAALAVLAGCAPAGSPGNTPTRRDVWEAVQPLAAMRGIDPLFVYAMVGVESGFDPRASRGEARGLLQIKPRAWRAVSSIPYEANVWDWRTNLSVGVDALASLKGRLSERGVFSYRLLWAAYHYGLDYVEARGFDMGRIPRPADPVSTRLWSGDTRPVDPPQ
ncbi:MAG TPA: transglycosylase SLT domain-containing protein [Opitutaceae bacterium]|nr:transglycosylase SLT domain-containing protein [Opitutaceae bacterium]